MKIRMLDGKVDVSQLQGELDANPELWNRLPLRTAHSDSPHREVDDIWLRYNKYENLFDSGQVWKAHESTWYPAVKQLPSVIGIAHQLLSDYGYKDLGGILITRVPAGRQVYPHIDDGWHAKYYEKVAVQVRGDTNQAFCFEGEELRTVDGDVYWFENSFTHWVVNQSERERITLICCMRRD